MDRNDRRKFENILREPLTRHRLALTAKLRAARDPNEPKPFTPDDLKAFLRGIGKGSPDIQKEVVNAITAIETGVAPQTPKFDTPETQLIWGAALFCLAGNPGQMKAWSDPPGEDALISSTPLWKQITSTRTAYQELLSHAHHVREALRDKATKYSWGEPGTGFGFDRQKNHINIDLVESMVVGFEHARADVYREIGQSLLSVTYPKRMQQIYREMQPLLKKSRLAQMKKGPQLKPEEYKQLRMLSAEWQLRHMMFAAAEENVANRFVANMGQQMQQDYSVSLNNTAVTHRAIGLTRLPPGDGMSPELRRYMNLCNAVQLSFFQNNSLFENTDDGWFKVGVDPNAVRKTATLAARPDDGKDDADGISHPDFEHLRELCGGLKGLEHQQPKSHERLYGWQNLTSRIARADAERKAIIEQIWSLYAEDLIQNILQQTNDEVDQQLKEAQEKQQQQEQDGDEGDDQDQDGQEQDGEGQGQGKPQKGKKGKKSKDRNKQQGEPQDPDDLEDGEDGEGEEQQQKDKQQKDKDGKGDKKDKKDGEKDGKDGEKEKAEGKLGTDEDETVPVEGAGDMAAPEAPNEVPADELDPNGNANDGEDGEGKDADGEDADGEDGQTLDELEDEMQEMDGEEGEGDDADADGEDADGEGQKSGKKVKGKKPGKQAGHGDGKKLGDLAKQDWTKYNERIAELAGPISRVRKLFKAVQERQVQRTRAKSRTLDILPENGEVKDRFNAEAHRDLTIKKALGNVEENDLRRFHKDETKMVPTEVDIVIMIDGSGSMGSGSPSPLDSALQASAILYEAAAGKDMKMNIYVGMWGDRDPPILIRPGDDRIKIGQAMQGARKGLSSGTDFAHAVQKVAKTIGEQRGRSGTLSGFTHVLILSDGDIFDAEESKKNIMTMFDYSDKVTFDAAIIASRTSRDTSMEKMAKSIKGRKPYQEVGIVISDNPEETPMAIVGILLEKVKKCGSFIAVPNNKKRQMMNRANNKMDRKP